MKTSCHFKTYDAWETAGIAAGYNGPYRITGQPHMQQFVKSGTEGMFNEQSGTGFLFLAEPHHD